MSNSDLKVTIREKYGEAALRASSGTKSGCCGASSCGTGAEDPITSNLYGEAETAMLPSEALLASLGCGNPSALAELREGEVVLDLGSGGGLDVLLSARRVGRDWKGIRTGHDRRDARRSRGKTREGRADQRGVPEGRHRVDSPSRASVDVIISNCVINLSGDKRKVISEAFRVLKPGGRFAVSDVVVRGELPATGTPEHGALGRVRRGCAHGGRISRYLREAGFEDASIEPTRVYKVEDARGFLAGAGLDSEVLAREVGGCVMGAFIRASKPAS